MTKKKAGSKTSKTTKYVSYKDVMIGFLLERTAYLDRMLAEKRLNPAVARHALKTLSTDASGAAGPFEAWVNKHMPLVGRGREAPQINETRPYRAQQLTTGGSFLRCPLTPLGIKKGQKVDVRFDADRIVITKAA